jgi:hypothetical protein
MRYCKVCALKEGHPGVVLDEEQICNLCKLELATSLLDNYTYTRAVFDEFQRAGPNPRGEYDCLLMYSGGKDSTYMLDKFVNEYGRKVLVYTFDVPFESVHAAENVKLAQEKIPAKFVFDSDDGNIKKMMREIFNRPVSERPGKYLDEKRPCASCRTFFVIRAILCAFRERIPFIVLCADPQQIVTMESNVREVVRGFYRDFGERLTAELFQGEVESLLFAADDELPKIVFPFISMRHEYNPERIVAELKAKGLYTSSPMETHCTLFPLLNYYSFKHWDCMFYKLNASSHLRAVRRNKGYDRTTFGIRFPASLDLVDVEEKLKQVVLEIVADVGNRATHEVTLTELFRAMGATEDAARFVAGNFLEMRNVAEGLGIQLDG